jgi:O-antigen/teichoic acid export membrane protein
MNPESRAARFERLTSTDAVRADLRSRSIRAVGFTGVAGFADLLLRIGSTAVLARLLLPEQFGVVMMALAVTAIADQFRDLGLSTATVQKETITHAETSNLFWINVSLATLMTLIVSGLSPALAAYYRDPRLIPVTLALASTFAINGLIVQHQALLARTLRVGTNAWVRLFASVLSTLLAIALAWQGYGYWALVWREVSRSAVLAVGVWMCMPWIPGLPSRATNISGLVRFGASVSAGNVLWTMGAGTDRFLLGRIWGADVVGIYRQAFQLLTVPLDQLLGPAYQVTQPALSLLQTQPVRFRKFYQKLLTTVCASTMPISLFVGIFAEHVVIVLLGQQWIACAPIVRILSIGGLFRQPVASAGVILIARGQSKPYLLLAILQTATTVVLMCVGVFWGAIGIAWAEVGATLLLIAPRLYYTFSDCPVTARDFFATVARPTVASLSMGAVLILVSGPLNALDTWTFLAAAGVLGATVFFGTWLLLPGGAGELRELLFDVRHALQKKGAPPPREEVRAASGVGL